MPTTKSENEKISYSSLTTMVFLGIVLILPISMWNRPDKFAFESYGLVSLILALWTFLREPIVQIKHRKMEPLSNKYPNLAAQISSLPAYVNLKNQPDILYIPSESIEFFSFGSWRRQYIAVSEGSINHWSNSADQVNIIATHEIAHIADGDVWKTGFSTHYLFWVFVSSVIAFFYFFPYSIFLTVYDQAVRDDLGLYNLTTSLSVLFMNFMLLFAMRFLYRMKEFAADEYAKDKVGLSDYIKVFAVAVGNKVTANDRRTTIKTSLQENLFKALSFHPTIQSRLSALQSSDYFIKELPSLMFVIGMVIGFASCLNLELYGSFGTMVVGEIAIGFMALTLSIPQKISQSFKDWTKLLAINISSLANGVAIAFCSLVGTNHLFAETKVGGLTSEVYYRQGMDFTYASFTVLDVLIIILIVVPIVILASATMSRLLVQVVTVKGITWQPKLFSLIGLFPTLTALCIYVSVWWGYGDWWTIMLIILAGPLLMFFTNFDNLMYIFSFCLLWLFIVTFLWRLLSHYAYKKISER